MPIEIDYGDAKYSEAAAEATTGPTECGHAGPSGVIGTLARAMVTAGTAETCLWTTGVAERVGASILVTTTRRLHRRLKRIFGLRLA